MINKLYKLYKTKTAEKLCTFSKQWSVDTAFGTFYQYIKTDLYRTKKGAYFIVPKNEFKKRYVRYVCENEAKQYLMHNNYSKYVELFGELEEARRRNNMTIRNLIEIACFNFSVNIDGNYYEVESLPNELIDFVYGEDFLNQEISLIEKDNGGKICVTLKEK